MRTACKQITQSDNMETRQLPARWPRLTDDPRHALQKNGGRADLWYMDDADTLCHPILVPSYLPRSTVTAGHITLGVAGRRHFSFSCARTADGICPPPEESMGVVASIIFCECTATRSCKSNEPLKFTTRWGSDLSGGSPQASRSIARHKQASPESVTRKRECGSGTPKGLIAAKARVQAVQL